MNNTILHLAAIILAVVLMVLCPGAFAQETDPLDVDVSAICTGVENLEPIGAGISFPNSIGELYCFTRITGALTPTTVTHVWYFEDTERGRMDLAVNAPRWRTFSSKIIQPHEIGSWRVEILDSEGDVLKLIQFITTPEQEAIPDAAPPEEPDHTESLSPPEITIE